MGEEGEVHVPYLSRLFYGLSNICSFMACLALLEILIPISLINSIPHQVYSLNWWTEWFPLLYVSIMPFGYAFFVSFRSCWSQLGFMRKTSLLKRQATRTAFRSTV